MISWYIKSRQLMRSIQMKAIDARRQCDEDQVPASKAIATYMKADFNLLVAHWHELYPDDSFGYLGRHIGFAEKQDFNDILNFDLPPIEQKLDKYLEEYERTLPKVKSGVYVSENRINEISETESPKHDTKKLIRLLQELNSAYASESFFSIGILVRAIIDHVPPIFEVETFAQVASNYAGTRSFKKSMKNLNDSLRNLADSYMHVQIRRSESLPTFIQVDFRADLDCMLSEISRILQMD